MTILNTKTNIFQSNGNISIYTFYQKCLNYINFWINGTPERVDGVQFKEGELGYKIDGYTDQFYVNQNGDLIVSGDQASIDKYSIDSNGNLVSNLDFCDELIIDPTPPLTGIKLGLMYNKYAVNDVRNLTSSGSRVATNADYSSLISYLIGIGTNKDAAIALKESGTLYWGYDEGSNTSKFNLRSSGLRGGDGVFYYMGLQAYLHSSDAFNYIDNFGLLVHSNHGESVGLQYSIGDILWTERSGQAVRTVKETTNLANGQEGVYIGNDGKAYRTICINGVEWLADNLAETKYRNGDLIPEVADNTAWSLLTTGALCAYNNDWDNVIEGGN